MPLILCAPLRDIAEAAGKDEVGILRLAEAESFGRTSGTIPVIMPDASYRYCLLFKRSARIEARLPLPGGRLTLFVRCRAPSVSSDSFYFEFGGRRRMVPVPVGGWTTVTVPFDAPDHPGPALLILSARESGLLVDTIGIARGDAAPESLRLSKLAMAVDHSRSPPPEALSPALVFARLNQVPQTPFRKGPDTLYVQHFDRPCPGASGDHAWTNDGRWGGALRLDMPDGRFVVDATNLDLKDTGTIEWWVRPRPAQQLWWDQGWHYFLFLRARDDASFQLDLSRHPLTGLRLVASNSEGPYYRDPEPGSRRWVQLSTSNASNETWHHLLVSWDVRGPRYDFIWLLLDGTGWGLRMPHTFRAAGFSRIELGNTPSHWRVPFLPMDGKIDELRVLNVSVKDRLEQ